MTENATDESDHSDYSDHTEENTTDAGLSDLGRKRLEHLAAQEPGDRSDPLASLDDLQESFDLTDAHPTGVARLLASGHVTLAGLFHDPAELTASERNLSHLVDHAERDRRAYGFGQIQLAVGVASWAQDRFSLPVLLFPVSLGQSDGRRLSRTPLFVRQQPQFNPRLLEMLGSRSIVLDPQSLIADATGKEGSLDTTVLLSAIQSVAQRHIADFEIDHRYIFGCFINPAAALVRRADAIASSTLDAPLIGRNGAVLGKHRHTAAVLALSGDHHALSMLRQQDLSQIDEQDPDPHSEREAGDVPSRVRKAAQAAADGASFFLDSPTGLESVPSALAVATRAAAQGRRVLVVPDGPRQKQEFLRLAQQAGVSSLVLDADDPHPEQKIDQEFVQSLSAETGRSTAVTDFNRTADELVGVRSRLGSYFDSLHKPMRPWNVSVYQSIEHLTSISAQKSKPRTRVRLSDEAATKLRGRLDAVGAHLVRMGELGEYTLRPSDTPWYGAKLYTAQEAKEASDRVKRLLQTTLPTVREQVSQTVKTCGFVIPESVQQWGSQISVLQSLRRVLDLFRPEIFEQDLSTALDATLSRKERKAAGVRMGFWARRRAIKEIRRCLHPGQRPDDLHATLQVVARQGERWHKLVPSGGWPVLPDGLDQIVETFDGMNQDLTALDAILTQAAGTQPLTESRFEDVDRRLRALWNDRSQLTTLPERMRLEREMRSEGLSDLLADLIDRKVSATAAPDELKLSWWTTVFESIVHSSRVIADQDASVLSDAVDRFRAVDRRHVATIGPLLVKESRRRLAEKLYAHRREANQLHDILRRAEGADASDIMSAWPTLAWAAKPIMVSSVAQLALHPVSDRPVDLVVLAGATHMPSAEVLVALESADSCVIVAHKSTATGEALSRLGEVLPTVASQTLLSGMPTQLAAFVERRGQKVSLLPVAGNGAGTVSLHRVSARGVPYRLSGLVESTADEVDEVTRCVIAAAVRARKQASAPVTAPAAPASLEHGVLAGPARPLTVFTLGEYNAHLIRQSLAQAARKSTDLQAFLPNVLVTALTGCAGARPGDVILSLGFAPTLNGVLLQQFGLLEEPGGDRMLLDALMRTRGSLTIVSAFASSDMQDERLHESGPRLLKILLRWAESLGVTGEGATAHPDREGVLMTDLASRLRERGVLTAIGYGFKNGVTIPLVAGTRQTGFRWAVLTDNERFMSLRGLRYRFRLLPAELRSCGWQVLSAWSVGTFIDPDSLVSDVLAAMGPDLVRSLRPAPMAGSTAAADASDASDPSEGSLFSGNPSSQDPRPAAQQPEGRPEVRAESVADGSISDLLAASTTMKADPTAPVPAPAPADRPAARPVGKKTGEASVNPSEGTTSGKEGRR